VRFAAWCVCTFVVLLSLSDSPLLTASGFVDSDVVPTRSRRRQPSPLSLEPVDDSSDGEDYPAIPPSVPTFGNKSAPLRVLIAWRSEVVAAGLEYDHAVRALEAAKLRRRVAWRNFYQVLGLEVAADPPIDPGKYVRRATRGGKGKQRANPIEVDDDGENSDDEFDVARVLGDIDGDSAGGSEMDL
jgi:hypothetical protein